MPGSWTMWPFLILLSLTQVYCDYDCVCNYAVETGVFPTPDSSGQPIGYLYEFDCKPKASGHQATNNFHAIQFEKQLGYVTSSSQLQVQTCPGNAQGSDLIPVTGTTVGQHSTTTKSFTTSTLAVTSKKATTSSPVERSTSTTSVSITSVRSTTPYSYWRQANVTGTAYEYIGVGYNILTGNPESSTDPGLKTAERIFQLTGNTSSIREATYQESHTCSPSNRTSVLYGSKSYQDELKLFVETSTTHMIQILESAFTYSPDFQAFRPFLDNDSVVYLDFISSCKLGSARYMTENAGKDGFTVTREFAKDVCALPTEFNSSLEYMRFFDKWGTSIITSVDMGTRQIERYQTTPGQLVQHAQQTQPQLLEHMGSFNGYPSSIVLNIKDYANSPAGSGRFGVGQQLSIGTNTQPDPIAVNVVPIYNALNWSYWQPIIDELTAEGLCSDSVYGTGMNHYAANFKTFLSQYSEYKATGFIHTALTDHQIQVPITWPVGTYGLMQTASGCPGANTHWSTGWRKQDTEDLRAHNTYTSGINNFLKGDFASNNIKTYFCTKTSHSTSSYDQTWQKGTYCLLKYGSCPNGFASGYIYWDDEDISNDNSKAGTLPDGTYDKNTKIYYCCRNDASPHTPLLLPTDRPFILLRYGSMCQTVHGMNVRDLYVKWDDEDLGNKDKAGGKHPLDDGGSKDHKLHFCYYNPSNSPSLIG